MTCAYILDKNTEYFHAFSLFQFSPCNLKHAINPFIKLQGAHQKVIHFHSFTPIASKTSPLTRGTPGHPWGWGGGWG